MTDSDAQFAKGGFLVRVDPPAGLELFGEVELEIALGADAHVARGQVVQLVPGVGVAVAFAVDAPLRALIDKARTAAPADGVAPVHELAVDDAPAPADKPAAPTKADLIKLAKLGNRDERMKILRSNDRSLHPHVLHNPNLRVDEVAAIARMTTISPEVYKQIADRKDWSERPEVALSLVRNPKVPTQIAIKMLAFILPHELRQIVKMGSLRTPILQAARKKLLC